MQEITLDKYLFIIFLVTMISIFEAGSQTLVYLSRVKKSILYFIFSLAVYFIVIVLLYMSYEYKGVGYVNVLWSGLTTFFMICIGYFYFGERLSKMEWIGASLILLGILLMTLHRLFEH
jgi:multidrug transporter EmrE-like cation transporter